MERSRLGRMGNNLKGTADLVIHHPGVVKFSEKPVQRIGHRIFDQQRDDPSGRK